MNTLFQWRLILRSKVKGVAATGQSHNRVLMRGGCV